MTDARARVGRRRFSRRRPVRSSWGVPAGGVRRRRGRRRRLGVMDRKGCCQPGGLRRARADRPGDRADYRPRLTSPSSTTSPGRWAACSPVSAWPWSSLSPPRTLCSAAPSRWPSRGHVPSRAAVLQAMWFVACRRYRRLRRGGRRTLVVGAGRTGRTVALALREHPELGLDPVGFADPDAVDRAAAR